MKTVLFIGDVHGKRDWEKDLKTAIKEFTEIVFLGDYTDSFNVKPTVIIQNLRQIIYYKKKSLKNNFYPKITLLLGNHDYAYIHDYQNIKGFDHVFANQYKELFNSNYDLFDIAWGYRDSSNKYTLVSHAGITNLSWNYIIKNHKDFINKILGDNLENIEMHKILNILKDKKETMFKVGSARGGVGIPGPLWTDFNDELIPDYFKGINQIVGHSAYYCPQIKFNSDGTYLIKLDNLSDTIAKQKITFI